MGNPKAFLTIHRQEAGYRPVHDRIEDFSEVEQTLNSADRKNLVAWIAVCRFAIGLVLSGINNLNGKTCFIGENGGRPI